MRKKSPIITNEQGLILPYVLFITTIIGMIVMTIIHSYQHDIAFTNRHIQQIKMETLFQMGYENVKPELTNQHSPKTVNYHFPDGHVNIQITYLEETIYELTFNISTNEDDSIFTFTKTVIIE